jgi:hypothetical protein
LEGHQSATHSSNKQAWVFLSFILNQTSEIVFVFLSPYDD